MKLDKYRLEYLPQPTMQIDSISQNLIRKHIALPTDHGSWVFLLSPLLIGLFAGGQWSLASFYLILAAMAAFLIRQPVSIAVKVYSRRRSKRDLPAAWFWIGVYGLVGLIALAGLIAEGYTYVLILALPGAPVFAWHLYLVSQRSERRQLGVELVATGVLALVAPAAYWVGQGEPDPIGWLLWVLVWFQTAASIVYAYLRLEQRELDTVPDIATRIALGRRALIYTTFNLLAVSLLSLTGSLPSLLFIPYALQWAETVQGTLRPAVNLRPTAIGIRQLIVSSLFTLLFILTWNP
ncbi:MAG TPA: YwiC-like family protein [Anaerolineales bacterium]